MTIGAPGKAAMEKVIADLDRRIFDSYINAELIIEIVRYQRKEEKKNGTEVKSWYLRSNRYGRTEIYLSAWRITHGLKW